jgi:hypothetical protein
MVRIRNVDPFGSAAPERSPLAAGDGAVGSTESARTTPEPAGMSAVFTHPEITPRRPHWLAEDTVMIAPVSGPNSLLTGNLTGNFSNLGLFLRFSLLIDEQLQSLAGQFPTQWNREFF